MTQERKRRRRNRDPKEMRAALARRRREGLSWSRLSEVTGIPLSTLQWWQKKLGEDDEADTGSDFVELLVRDDVESDVIESFEVVLWSGARDVPGPGRSRPNSQRPAALRGPRAPRVPRLWNPRPRFFAGALHRVWPRRTRCVFMQRKGFLSVLCRPAHGRDGGASRRRRDPRGSRAPSR